ncbi:MAG: DHH family phosphoesterase, partial [Candidatus Brocadiae bacterium]|nr:DHH family phosphoesterase [Candidatus Brocadiia bacterium]
MAIRTAPTRLKQLLDALRPGPVLILMHDNPDPDCFASAAGLRFLLERTAGVSSTIAYGGLIGRASNKTLLRALDIDVRHVDQIDFSQFPRVATVDTQPRGGNNSLPADRVADAVIDHHAPRKATRACPFADVRTAYGATCTMIVQYLNEAEIEIPQSLATLIFYAIRTETQELGREASKADVDAYMEFFPVADLELVSSIERARIPRDFFQTWHRALLAARIHAGAATCPIGAVQNPDMIPEVADMLLRLEGITWSVACGYHAGQVIFSLRTSETGAAAGALAQRVAGRRGTAG